MANHKSAEKAERQIQKRTAINRSRMSRIKTFIKKLDASIASGDNKLAREMLSQAQSEIMRGASKGLLKLKTASRKVKRLALKVKNMVA